MCPFFVPKVIRNLVALLMYSERYWLINALSAHNPLGSMKGTGEKTSSFSQYVFSPLPGVQKTCFFSCWQSLTDKRLNICQVMHSKQHWSSWMSLQLLWKAWQGIALILALLQSWPWKSMSFTCCRILQHLKAREGFTALSAMQRKQRVWFEPHQSDAIWCLSSLWWDFLSFTP